MGILDLPSLSPYITKNLSKTLKTLHFSRALLTRPIRYPTFNSTSGGAIKVGKLSGTHVLQWCRTENPDNVTQGLMKAKTNKAATKPGPKPEMVSMYPLTLSDVMTTLLQSQPVPTEKHQEARRRARSIRH